jgi:hypothetical protein
MAVAVSAENSDQRFQDLYSSGRRTRASLRKSALSPETLRRFSSILPQRPGDRLVLCQPPDATACEFLTPLRYLLRGAHKKRVSS